ncbi:hypothetical protein, partial [Comamonas sp.]
AHEEGEKQNLIHILSLAAQVKGWVSLRWKWRVSFAWKLTLGAFFLQNVRSQHFIPQAIDRAGTRTLSRSAQSTPQRPS